ncbi:hypothetical protein L596_022706 [Steinernema carpocapsae]|uniref:Uncharacterized protein n=1 Tax=Steinernema carpocapsae TaxID=34508 RepID=A0A4U5MMK2_STECR|nr:hypothetical protein L596_022706 [Steinernema carpocapsae]
MLFFAVLLLVGFWRVQACERGLTQLRYPKTLELIRCTPGSNGDDDPCWSLAKNNSAQCQLDKGGEHVCCGTTNLLIQLLANTMITRRLQEHSLLERTPSPPFLRVFSNGIDPDFLFSSRSKPFTHTDYKSNYGSENQWFEPTHEPRINVVPALPKFHLTTSPEPVHNHIQEEISIPPRQEIPIEFEGPTVTLLATGKLIKGSDGGSYLARSTVVLVQDGNCRIVVNTGMPSQVEELKLGLTAIGLSDPIFDFTVINSNLPPYIGNLNLFKSNKLLLENMFEVESDTFRQFPPMNDPINLCSPQVQLLFTPGATNDGTTVLVRNVPSMGTVAVVVSNS